MATQVKFYSTTAASYAAIANKDAGGVYFVDGGELYKGTSRFGANKVYPVSNQTQLSAITDQIAGDLAVGFGWTKAWNGTAWVQIENDAQITALISNTVPSFIPPVVSSMVSGLSVGNANSYITHITQDANGKVKAYAQLFPAYSAAQIIKSSTMNGITASVTTSKGQVTAVSLYAADLTPTTVSAQTGTFTNLTVTNNANFSVTNVSATALTIGGSTVEQLADKQIAAIGSVLKTSTSNGITVSVTTSSGSVSKVEVNASAFGNVMRFRGIVASTANVTNPASGDIVVIGANPTGGAVTGQEYIYDGTKWELIGDQATYATKADLNFKASIGTSNAAGGYGISGQLSLYSNAKPSLTITVSPVTTSAGITTTANTVVTASAVANYAMKKGDVTGGNSSSSMNGVGVKVVTAATTAAPTVTMYNFGTAASKHFTNAITAAGTSLPTESAVYSAI